MAAAQAAHEEAQVSLSGSTAAAAALSVPACCYARMYPPVANRLKPACHTAGNPFFFLSKSLMSQHTMGDAQHTIFNPAERREELVEALRVAMRTDFRTMERVPM